MRVETEEIVSCPMCGDLMQAVYIQRATLFVATQTSELLPCMTCVAAMSRGFRVGNAFREQAVEYNPSYVNMPSGKMFDPDSGEVHLWYGPEDFEFIEPNAVSAADRRVILRHVCPD